jgi:hypothetical protein
VKRMRTGDDETYRLLWETPTEDDGGT